MRWAPAGGVFLAAILAALALSGSALVPGVKATCRWEPNLETVCRAASYGEHLPSWEVRDVQTGELLHRGKGAYVRLTLSAERWRDVTLIAVERGTTTMRLRWAPRALQTLRRSHNDQADPTDLERDRKRAEGS